ncbi:MAG: TonB-dependent receptor [Thermoanaerobaculia bacterium]
MKLHKTVVAALALLFVATLAFGQGATTSVLSGTVTNDGTALPGVTVTIASPALQGVRTAVTNENGGYNFPAIPPGLYTVTFEMDGMQTIEKKSQIGLAQTAKVDAAMKLSTVAEAITVTASAPAVLETQEVESNISAKLVEDLPLARTLVGTVSIAPGVTQNGPNGGTVISGAPSFDSLWVVNGAVVNENLRGQPHDLFIEDALQETTVLNGAISAEYGRFTGGVVTAISKSGGNDFSGSFRDSFTNPSWTAKTPLNEPDPIDSLNEVYEATFGGRIIRDRLWFFTAGRYFDRSTQQFFTNSTIPFTNGRKQQRLEGKLTGQITPSHSVVVSALDITDKETNNCFGSCYEPSALDKSRELPNSFLTVHYNGIFASNLLLEGAYSKKDFSFKGSGGDFRGRDNGTNVYSYFDGAYLGAPTFCGVCGDEERNNENWQAKATYYLSAGSFGTHNIVAGYDDWSETIKSNNYQSGSDFTIWEFTSPTRNADGSVFPTFETGDFIIWWPILEASKGTDFKTRSTFVNDKWDLNSKMSFNLGLRYDANKGYDGSGQLRANDSKFSPRLGAIYDVNGNGKLRFNVSYSKYVSKIADGNVGDAASPAGSPSYLYWYYAGPTISGLPTTQALAQLFSWFDSVGGVNNTDFLLGGGSNGIQTQIPNSLKSPGVDEYTAGVGSQLGNGFLRLDYIHRKWNDFYTTRTDQSTGQAFDPLANGYVDVAIVQNSDEFTRKYEAFQLQGNYRIMRPLTLGGNYTWSKLRGNLEGETSGSGPVAGTGSDYYPEYTAFARNNPIGYLAEDQRHKARVWVTYDLPTPAGDFNFSALERYDSGTPYSAVGGINDASIIGDYGYNTPPSNINYYFSDRGAFRWDNVTATDLSVNYTFPIRTVQLFLQGELLNAFDENAQIAGDTTVLTARNSNCHQADGSRCAAFNPFTDTPVLGVNYQYGSNFGKALNVGDYQLPRTYRFSAGVRF